MFNSLSHAVTSRPWFATLVLANVCMSPLVIATPGQPGTMDATFGSGGVVAVEITTGTDIAAATVLQSDGKLVVAGTCGASSARQFCATRLLTNGTLDSAFGTGGKVTTTIGAGSSLTVAKAVALQTDRKILVAGECAGAINVDFCVVRYLANGTLDSTFGTGGRAITAIGNGVDRASAVNVQSNGGILISGQCGNDFCVARYLTSGALDTSFGIAGAATAHAGVLSNTPSAAALQTDDRLVVAGSCYGGVTAFDFCAVRFNLDGSLDATFGNAGALVTPVSNFVDAATGVAFDISGRLLLTGHCSDNLSGVTGFCAARYHSDGVLDATFGASGITITPIQMNSVYSSGLALQANEYLVVTGVCTDSSSNFSICSVRYRDNGSLDLSYGEYGVAKTAPTPTDTRATAVIRPDGRIAVATSCRTPDPFEAFCVVQYEGGSRALACGLDLDGDQRVVPTIDSLIYIRVAVGLTGSAAINGIQFPSTSTRTTWSALSSQLSANPLDIDGDTSSVTRANALLHARLAIGMKTASILDGITLSPGATRTTWPAIRDYLNARCGVELP